MTSVEPGDEAASSGRLVEVFASASIPEGLLAKGLLESAGIPVVEKGMAEGPYRMAPIYLWVPEELEAQARTLLDAARSGRGVAEPGEVGTARASRRPASASRTAAPSGPSSARTCAAPSPASRG